MSDWRNWALAACGLALVASVIVSVLRADDADDARARADSAVAEAQAAKDRADSLGAIADSLEAARDSVLEREAHVRDSLGRELALAQRETEAAELTLDSASTDEDSAIARALRIVDRPEEEAAVRAIARADSVEDTNRDRLLRAQRRLVELTRDSAASLGRENRQLRETLHGVTRERDALRETVHRLEGALAAKDDVIAALETDWWEALIGEGLVEGAVTVGTGALSYVAAEEKGLVGWGLAKAGDLVVSSVR